MGISNFLDIPHQSSFALYFKPIYAKWDQHFFTYTFFKFEYATMCYTLRIFNERATASFGFFGLDILKKSVRGVNLYQDDRFNFLLLLLFYICACCFIILSQNLWHLFGKKPNNNDAVCDFFQNMGVENEPVLFNIDSQACDISDTEDSLRALNPVLIIDIQGDTNIVEGIDTIKIEEESMTAIKNDIL